MPSNKLIVVKFFTGENSTTADKLKLAKECNELSEDDLAELAGGILDGSLSY